MELESLELLSLPLFYQMYTLYMRKKKLLYACFALFLILRLYGLGTDISNSDALRWHKRSVNFLMAIKSLDFKSTYQHYQPGVTLMWIDSVVNQLGFWTQETLKQTPKTLENSDYYVIENGAATALIVIILFSLLILQTKLIEELWDEKTAIYFAFLMSVEPYLIGIDRWFHLTSIETYFALTSILLLLVWKKNGGNRLVVFSAFFLSLSVLSKLTTLIILPVYIYIFVSRLKRSGNLGLDIIKSIGVFATIFIITTLLFFPALLFDTAHVLQKLYSAVNGAVSNDLRVWVLPKQIEHVFYFLILLFKLSPVTLLFFILTVLNVKKLTQKQHLFPLALVLILYFTSLSLTGRKIDRYAVVMFPYVILLISVYFSVIKRLGYFAAALSLIFIVYITYLYSPVFSAYYSPLFGGTKMAYKIGVYDNSGEYYAQSALFLNTLGRNKNTYVPYNVDSFSPFYKGTTLREYVNNVDFIVTSVDHLNSEKIVCRDVFKTFGSKVDKIVYVFKCGSSI